MRSFRLRLFGLAALGACVLLAGVFALVIAGQRRHEIERLDQRLCIEAHRVAGLVPAEVDDRERADLMTKLRLSSPALRAPSLRSTSSYRTLACAASRSSCRSR